MSYKNCNWCGWCEDGLFPDGLRCPLCLTSWDAKTKFVGPPSKLYNAKEHFE